MPKSTVFYELQTHIYIELIFFFVLLSYFYLDWLFLGNAPFQENKLRFRLILSLKGS